MKPSREQVYQQFFEFITSRMLVANGGPIVTASRRLRFVEEEAPENMPSLYQFQGDQVPQNYTYGGAGTWEFFAELYIYVSAPDDTAPSTPILNPIVDSVMDLFQIDEETGGGGRFEVIDDDGSELTCGVSVIAPIQVWEGLLGSRAAAIIPVRIQVPTA